MDILNHKDTKGRYFKTVVPSGAVPIPLGVVEIYGVAGDRGRFGGIIYIFF